MKFVVRFLSVVEIEVDSEAQTANEEAQAILDAVLPSENYGVAIYRATPDDLSDDFLARGVELVPSSE